MSDVKVREWRLGRLYGPARGNKVNVNRDVDTRESSLDKWRDEIGHLDCQTLLFGRMVLVLQAVCRVRLFASR